MICKTEQDKMQGELTNYF